MKHCGECGVRLTDKTGIRRKSGPAKGKFRNTCKTCGARLAKQWRADNPERAKKQLYAWKARNPEKVASYKRKAAYGISLDQFKKMIAVQRNLCQICKLKMFPSKNRHVDHCHRTGKVRGLLCSKCNTALGLLDDSPERLRAAAAYLEKVA